MVVTAFDDIANGTFRLDFLLPSCFAIFLFALWPGLIALYTNNHLRAFLELCDKVGGEVAQLGPMVDKAFKVLMKRVVMVFTLVGCYGYFSYWLLWLLLMLVVMVISRVGCNGYNGYYSSW